MKTSVKKLLGLTAILSFLLVSGSFAQRGQMRQENRNFEGKAGICERIPDLTAEQEENIEKLRIAHMDEMQDFRNQMNELRAMHRTLMTSDNIAENEINTNIDQITSLKNKMMKASAKHRREVRSQLTDDQKVYFDQMGQRRGNRDGRGNKHGQKGHGRGMNRGF